MYFRVTGGGVTFGGGKPGLQTEFICEFKKICPPQWKIRLETALQFHYQYTELLAPIVDEWIVDVALPPKPPRKKVLFKECAVAGVFFI